MQHGSKGDLHVEVDQPAPGEEADPAEVVHEEEARDTELRSPDPGQLWLAKTSTVRIPPSQVLDHLMLSCQVLNTQTNTNTDTFLPGSLPLLLSSLPHSTDLPTAGNDRF